MTCLGCRQSLADHVPKGVEDGIGVCALKG